MCTTCVCASRLTVYSIATPHAGLHCARVCVCLCVPIYARSGHRYGSKKCSCVCVCVCCVCVCVLQVTSSAKKKRDPTSTRISQTPDGSFYDLQRNAWHLLQQCNVKHTPELGSVEQYLQNGPGFIFLFNPALGE